MLNADLQSFTYSSQPHAAPAKATSRQQPRYRDPNETPLTLMSDPRVIRGSTHTLARKITLSKNELSKSQGLVMTRKGPPETDQQPRPSYTFVVKPFSNDEIDVSQYLVQQTDFRPQKKALDTQTDEFIPRPDTPEYVPAKVGYDVGTQVEDASELFNFDQEVIPIVEVVVQKTIEQALFELSSEEELKNLETAAKEFRAEKFQSEEWMRNRENQAIKENKQRRDRIEALKVARENEVRTKTIIAGVAMMRQTFDHSFQSICDSLVKKGVWKEIDNAVAEKDFVPEALDETNKLVQAHAAAQELLDSALMETEALYQTFPSYAAAQPRRMLVELTFRRAPTEGDAPAPGGEEGGEGEEAKVAPPAANRDTTVMTVQVGARDSIDSLTKRIRNEVYRLKQLAAKRAEEAAAAAEAAPAPAVDEEGEPIPAPAAVVEEGPVVNSVLPDSASLSILRSSLYEALAASLSPELLVNPVAPAPGVPVRALVRDIAYDGALWSFPFPEMVKLEMFV